MKRNYLCINNSWEHTKSFPYFFFTDATWHHTWVFSVSRNYIQHKHSASHLPTSISSLIPHDKENIHFATFHLPSPASHRAPHHRSSKCPTPTSSRLSTRSREWHATGHAVDPPSCRGSRYLHRACRRAAMRASQSRNPRFTLVNIHLYWKKYWFILVYTIYRFILVYIG